MHLLRVLIQPSDLATGPHTQQAHRQASALPVPKMRADVSPQVSPGQTPGLALTDLPVMPGMNILEFA